MDDHKARQHPLRLASPRTLSGVWLHSYETWIPEVPTQNMNRQGCCCSKEVANYVDLFAVNLRWLWNTTSLGCELGKERGHVYLYLWVLQTRVNTLYISSLHVSGGELENCNMSYIQRVIWAYVCFHYFISQLPVHYRKRD